MPLVLPPPLPPRISSERSCVPVRTTLPALAPLRTVSSATPGIASPTPAVFQLASPSSKPASSTPELLVARGDLERPTAELLESATLRFARRSLRTRRRRCARRCCRWRRPLPARRRFPCFAL